MSNIMAQLFVDENISSDVLNAIQTILNAFAKVRQDRDDLLNRVKCLKCEEQENLLKRDVESSFDCFLMQEEPTNQRKRVKTECENKDHSNYETSRDELNAAFHSTSIEDDVIAPTQCDPNQLGALRPRKVSPFNRGQCSNEQNKENQNRSSLKAYEKSPTALGKNSKKNEVKASHNVNESPKWLSKVSTKSNKTRQTRIFDNCNIQKEVQPDSKNLTSSITRKRVPSSLSFSTTRLKQSTLNFPVNDDETYCEGASCQIDDYKKVMNKNSSAEETHLPLSSLNLSTRFDGKSYVTPTKTGNDDSVAFVKCLNEVITIEESQPTQELYKHIIDIKEELRNRTSPEPIISSKKPKSVAGIQKMNFNCADCEEYHRMLGRNLEKDFPKKYGVCSKHRRNNPGVETPPGFWNPKIVDTDSEHEETYCEVDQ